MCKCRSHGTFPLFGLQSSHLNICYYHQDLHRRPLRPGSRPRFCSDRRALLLIGAWHLPRRPGIGRALQRHPFSGLVDSADERFARQYRCGPPPEFPLASPHSGIVHHLSGPDKYAHTRTLLRRSRLLGPCFKTGQMGSPQADARSTQMPKHAETARSAHHDHSNDVSMGITTARAWAVAAIRIGPRPESIGRPACHGTHQGKPWHSPRQPMACHGTYPRRAVAPTMASCGMGVWGHTFKAGPLTSVCSATNLTSAMHAHRQGHGVYAGIAMGMLWASWGHAGYVPRACCGLASCANSLSRPCGKHIKASHGGLGATGCMQALLWACCGLLGGTLAMCHVHVVGLQAVPTACHGHAASTSRQAMAALGWACSGLVVACHCASTLFIKPTLPFHRLKMKSGSKR
ncbi:hypothetical protein FH972_007806 [Carpinus fangiana]|uniref:Uncharacterized protein n=1 Tax=Carpinus fangiana TaxID=176857 RepID=A0A5N6QWM5_9ROSI|nr:hypothetical protein FH972_007806 [Carpinus fangiana]